MKGVFKIVKKLIISILLSIILTISLIYYKTNIYNFPPPTPFSGDSLINPYQSIDNDIDKSKSIKCNFHAHAKAWGGLTNGYNSDQLLTGAYKKQGYSVAGVSNYHCIKDSSNNLSPIYIPIYEHGVNINKSHLLVLNATSPSYFDFPLWQNTSQKQEIINRISNKWNLVAIAHPKFLNGHSIEDMAQLTGYQFVEVLNHYRISDEYWDAALTAGRLVYGIGNDDTHDINNEPTFKMWTEVFADTATADGVLNALRQGKSYAVHAFEGKCDLKLDSIFVNGDLVDLYVTGPVKEYEWWRAGHVVDVATILPNTITNGQSHIQKRIDKRNPYLRIVVKSNNCALYLNPIIRSKDGKTAGIQTREAQVDVILTLLYRLSALVVCCFSIALLMLMWINRKN